MIKDILDQTGGRKFFIAFVILIITLVTRAMGGIDGAQFVTIVLGVMGLYATANVGQKALDMINAKPPVPALSKEAALTEFQAKVQAFAELEKAKAAEFQAYREKVESELKKAGEVSGQLAAAALGSNRQE